MKYKRYPKINEEVYTLTLENKLKVYYIPRTGFQNKIAIIATRFGSLHSNQTVMILHLIIPKNIILNVTIDSMKILMCYLK